MRKSILYVAFSVLAIICMSSAKEAKITENTQVMLFGIAYTSKCNKQEVYLGHTYKLVSYDNLLVEKRNMQNQLESRYPNASWINVSDSQSKYGLSARNMCIIKWYKENNNCTYGVVYFAFGQTHQEAVDKAIAQKNSWGGSNVSYDIIENKYW